MSRQQFDGLKASLWLGWHLFSKELKHEEAFRTDGHRSSSVQSCWLLGWTTTTFAQGTGPGNMGPEVMGAQGWMQCIVPITSTQPFSLTAQSIFGYGQSGQGGFGPE